MSSWWITASSPQPHAWAARKKTTEQLSHGVALRDKGVDFETGIMNRKSAVLRDKRGEHGKEEEDGREAGRRMTASNPSSSPLPWSCWLSCIVLRLSAD